MTCRVQEEVEEQQGQRRACTLKLSRVQLKLATMIRPFRQKRSEVLHYKRGLWEDRE
jgi:hypothetical protein